jgi:hypothetical protein
MPKASQNPADALRTVPPREFVRARNALAAKLAKDGKRTESRDIHRLPRPSPVVWALNRTAVARPRELSALVEAMDRLRRAQLGQGELRATTERYRAAFEPLVRNAAETLHDAGSAVSPALERRIRSTLLAAITDRRLRASLAAGRLSGEHTEPGFAVLSQDPVPAAVLRVQPAKAKPVPASGPEAISTRAAPGPQHRDASSRQRREEAEARRGVARQSRATRQAARQAHREARVLNRDARQKERAAGAAEKELDAVRRTLQQREQQSAALRAAADQAREASDKAEERARTAKSRPTLRRVGRRDLLE